MIPISHNYDFYISSFTEHLITTDVASHYYEKHLSTALSVVTSGGTVSASIYKMSEL